MSPSSLTFICTVGQGLVPDDFSPSSLFPSLLCLVSIMFSFSSASFKNRDSPRVMKVVHLL